MNYSYIMYSNRMREIDKNIGALKEKVKLYKKYIKELEEEKKIIAAQFLGSNNNMVSDIDISHLLSEEK